MGSRRRRAGPAATNLTGGVASNTPIKSPALGKSSHVFSARAARAKGQKSKLRPRNCGSKAVPRRTATSGLIRRRSIPVLPEDVDDGRSRVADGGLKGPFAEKAPVERHERRVGVGAGRR